MGNNIFELLDESVKTDDRCIFTAGILASCMLSCGIMIFCVLKVKENKYERENN